MRHYNTAFLVLINSANACQAFLARQNPRNGPFLRAHAQADLMFVGPDMSTIEEEACRDTAALMKLVPVPVSPDVSSSGSVGISYVHWPAQGTRKSKLPLVMIHGFDSSCLEFRRLGTRLAARGIDTYAVDLLGWGYTQLNDVDDFSARAKVDALQGFIGKVLGGRSVCIAGASLGGAASIELAYSSPDICEGLILMDAQGFVDGVGPMATLPKPVARLGVSVLKSVPLRSSANQMSYFDTETYATDDAVRIGRLHCLRDGWSDALVSFMLSDGFSPSEKVAAIAVPALVIWGRQDGILDGEEFASKFVETLPNAQLRWIEECGHVPHLEKPDETADAIAEFLLSDQFSSEKPPEWVWGGVVAGTTLAASAAVASGVF